MATITEDYVSFETAKLLKDKGFDGECSMFYMPNGNCRWKYEHYHDFDISERIECPTIQMAMKWLREVHKLVITISILNENNKGNTDYSNPDRWFYFFDITNEKGVVIDIEYDPLLNEFSTYEEACEAGIQHCLKHLI